MIRGNQNDLFSITIVTTTIVTITTTHTMDIIMGITMTTTVDPTTIHVTMLLLGEAQP